jgi:hypothetical protein
MQQARQHTSDTVDMAGTAKAAPVMIGDIPCAAPQSDGGTEAEVSDKRGVTVGDGATAPTDPINMPMVVKLKQTLKAQRLKVGGTKQIQHRSSSARSCEHTSAGGMMTVRAEVRRRRTFLEQNTRSCPLFVRR